MLKVPRKMVFAVEAVLDIAFHGSAGPVASADITGRQGIPRRYLEQVLQQLVRAGILTGLRGPRGGYRLARERRRISVASILRAVAGGEAEAAEGDDTAGSPLARLVVRPILDEVLESCVSAMDGITIDDLCRRAIQSGARRPADGPVDFSI